MRVRIDVTVMTADNKKYQGAKNFPLVAHALVNLTLRNRSWGKKLLRIIFFTSHG